MEINEQSLLAYYDELFQNLFPNEYEQNLHKWYMGLPPQAFRGDDHCEIAHYENIRGE